MPEETRLSPICKWKNIFIRVHHLNKNWEKGRYSVSPLLKGHSEKVTAIACNGKKMLISAFIQILIHLY